MKKLLLASMIVAATCGSVVADENMVAHTAFKADVADIQDQFYRSLRISDWEEMGAKRYDIEKAMRHLIPSNGEALLDVENLNEPGYWTYEFIKVAQALEFKAEVDMTAENYQRASAAYLIASYPNLNRPNEIFALDKAVDLYLKAEELRGSNTKMVSLERSDGRSVPGILHLPKGGDKNVPAIIWTGGVDKTLIEHRSSFAPMLEKGYAVLTLDMPGAGLDYKNHLEVDKEDISHQAAFEFLVDHPLIDKNRIGALSSSGSGSSIVQFAIKQPKLKAVVARCALVDGPLSSKESMKHIPKMSAHSFVARIGGDSEDLSYLEDNGTKFSLVNRGIFDGSISIDTPLLAINTKKDPVAMPDDVKKTASISTNGEVFLSDEFGHCPDSKEASDKIIKFLSDNV